MEERMQELRTQINEYMSYIFITEDLIKEAEEELRSLNEALDYQSSINED